MIKGRWTPANKGHRAGERGKYCLYNVWCCKTGLPVAAYVTAEQAARAMGLTMSSFYCTVTRCKKRQTKSWIIQRIHADEVEE